MIYEFDIDILKVYTQTKYGVFRSRAWTAGQTDITDRQTDTDRQTRTSAVPRRIGVLIHN